MWPFDDPLNLSPLYNLILGAILIFAGLFAMKAIPGKFFSFLIGIGMVIAGAAIAIGYWVIL